MKSTSLQDFSATTWSRFYELDVLQMSGNYYVRKAEPEKEVGVLDVVTAEILSSLRQRPQIMQIAVLDASSLPKLPKKNKPQHVVIDISINFLGPSHMIDDVGAALTKTNGFLQHPCFLPAGTPYINPHYYYPHGTRTDLTHLVGPPMEDSEASDLAHGLGDVLNSLAESDWSSSLASTLSAAEGKITTSLKRLDQRSTLSPPPFQGLTCTKSSEGRRHLDPQKRRRGLYCVGCRHTEELHWKQVSGELSFIRRYTVTNTNPQEYLRVTRVH